MNKKGSFMFVKEGKIKAVYLHRNAELEAMGKRIVKMIQYFELEELNELFDYLIPVDEEEAMTAEQIEAYKEYMPEQCWKEDLDWTTAIMYTKDPTKPIMDGFPYFVDYAGFLPSWRNRFRYTINLDNNTFQVAKAGLEIISQETDEFSDTAEYVDKIAPCVLGVFPLDSIPEDWIEQCKGRWNSWQLKVVPYDEIATQSTKNESDFMLQHDAEAMKFYIGIENY